METENAEHLSMVSRISSGGVLLAFFVFGTLANATICRRLSQTAVLFRNTRSILLYLAITDFFGCVVLLPMQFICLALYPTSHVQTLSLVFRSLRNFSLWMECSCVVLLSFDRQRVLRNALRRLSTRAVTLSLASAWILACMEAILTYFTTSLRVPWKFSTGISRDIGSGDVVASLFVIGSAAVVFLSFRRIQNFVNQTSIHLRNSGVVTEARINKRRRMVNLACSVTIGALLLSYVPAIIAFIVWWVSGLQCYEFNAFCAVVSCAIHVMNPVICAAQCRELRRGRISRGPLRPGSQGVSMRRLTMIKRGWKVTIHFY